MTYCSICEYDLPNEAKYLDHTELLHPKEVPAVIADDVKDVKRTLEQLGVTVSDTFPEDPVVGQIHYDLSYVMYVYDGKMWTPMTRPSFGAVGPVGATGITGPVGPIGVAGTTGTTGVVGTTSTVTSSAGSYGVYTTSTGGVLSNSMFASTSTT